MFRAINTESLLQKKKANIERKKLKEVYMNACRTLNIKDFLKEKVVYESNEIFYRKAKVNLYIQIIKNISLEIFESMFNINELVEYEELLFLIGSKYISEKKYIRAKKILNIAIEKGWYSNKLFNLLETINKECNVDIKVNSDLPNNSGIMERKINIDNIFKY